MTEQQTKGSGMSTHVVSNVKVSRDEKLWEVEISAEIPAEGLAHYRDETLNDIRKNAKLDGFRPGKAPIERIVQIYGEDVIARQSSERAIQHELPEMFAKENLMIIETPKVTIDMPKAGKSTAFTARAALAPKIELADYKAIAAQNPPTGGPEVEVSDTEHQEAMTHMKRERARIDKIEAGTEPQKAAEESRTLEEKDLPALDDEFVQALGYENVEKFSGVLRTNIQNEKEIRAREKRRAAILEDLVKNSKVFYPAMLRDYELDDMEARLKDDVERSGGSWEGYLAEVKKTREEIRASWHDAADKRAKVRLILGEIARKEKIEPDEKALAHELEHARKQYPQADPSALRAHIAHAMRNDATLKFLESIS
ncbi:MAG: Trigger factor [Candidatus Kaiserbacteria bacterium GW2011_GWB1_52_6]|uniref:Trigger factor n=3 Tax=Candidatus Kaiseribacteriota TaxID=1752734 RepID=A0A0G1XJR4_9BACT|nr:MAG: Trigger factor [Candidatus Kaiserbacteria bacterium GW2011_GWA2_52_12]KKW26352.1 MAG: Trigger factor [Candidatus Kaiserbacteria bacterium GW2011_GWB1_52_6]KKW31095.1 MAG: Trigger factor [Candidatus Kaiserbacteria bacterium GW2011_GWC2_52_8b]